MSGERGAADQTAADLIAAVRHPIIVAAAMAYVAESVQHERDPMLSELEYDLVRDPGFRAAIAGAFRAVAGPADDWACDSPHEYLTNIAVEIEAAR